MISCGDYDYIEIACLYRYPVSITLRSGEIIAGQATDTVRNESGLECLKLQTEGVEQLVVLDEIKILKTTIQNARFDEVIFD